MDTTAFYSLLHIAQSKMRVFRLNTPEACALMRYTLQTFANKLPEEERKSARERVSVCFPPDLKKLD